MPTSGPPNDRPNPGTWCPATKNQGSGGGEAPRPAHRTPAGPRRRGAPRRKIKALTGARHHVRPTECPPDPATWCPATKDQGFDGGEAPRPAHRMPGRARRRGAPRRKIKALTGVKHHVPEGKNDEYKKTWCKKLFRPFAFRFFTPSLSFVPIKIVLF